MWENIQVKRKIIDYLPLETTQTIVLITGARQTGKTTLVKEKYSSLPYFNLDAIELRDQLSAVSTFTWARDVGSAIIDEIQKEPSLFEKIKYSYDDGKLYFSVLTGSSQLLLLKKVRETMAGRIKLFELFPLMISELTNPDGQQEKIITLEKLLNTTSIDDVFNSYASILFGEEWELHKTAEDWLLVWGGMPSLIHINDENERINWLYDYSVAYLERDLTDLARLSDLRPFRKFQSIAALRAANMLHYTELAKDSGTSVETARRYLEYLNISYQNFLLQPYYKNLTSSLVKTPKLFWLDNGLLRQSSGLGFKIDTGQLFENYFASELMKYIRTTKSRAKLFYYRTRSGMEIDFIIETQHGIIAIETKSRDKVTRSDFSALHKLATAAGKLWLGGIVAYRGNKIEKFGDMMWAVPSSRLLS
jgi:predicted AAA+ superfamily ATPase